MQFLQPMEVVDICLAAGSIFCVSDINEAHIETHSFKNLKSRSSVDSMAMAVM